MTTPRDAGKNTQSAPSDPLDGSLKAALNMLGANLHSLGQEVEEVASILKSLSSAASSYGKPLPPDGEKAANE